MNADIHKVLFQYWGYNKFRPLQEDIIQSVLDGNDTLALMPTGGGKSICYQIPGLSLEGICIVISPLIALMEDQVQALNAKNIKAITINSGSTKSEIDNALENCVFGSVKFLYLSPERLETDIVKARMPRMNINLVAVDEAHCISQWGYDFRPAYLKIAEHKNLFGKAPLLALTATATKAVRKDIMEKLLFPKENIFIKSFERTNLSYSVLIEEDKMARMLKVLQGVNGSSVIYVRNRKRTTEIAQYLLKNKISAGYYHAGLSLTERKKMQQNWIQNKLRVIVATNAFGMGIDKADVRSVIHLDVPDSIEAYYQEAGRAGRDEKKAFAVLLSNEEDNAEIEKRVKNNYPEIEEVKNVYQALCNYLQIPSGSGQGVKHPFDINDFCSSYKMQAIHVMSCIRLLEQEEYLQLIDSPEMHSKLHITIDHSRMYEYQVMHPKANDLLQILLRMYEGLFSGYVNISENDISKKSKLSPDKVVIALQHLKKNDVLDYHPAINKPQIIFTKERLDAKKLHFNLKRIEERKSQTISKLKSIFKYIHSTDSCRSQMLLSYFSEDVQHRCGICDYCLQRNKLELNEVEFEQTIQAIQNSLSSEPKTLRQIVDATGIAHENRTIKVINFLLENKKLRMHDAMKLTLNI